MNTKIKCDFSLIGKRIGNARREANLTQEQLAANVGIGVKHLSEIERGISGVAVGTLIEIANVLKISTDYILLGTETERTPLDSRLSQISESQRLYLEDIITAFINCCLDNKQNS